MVLGTQLENEHKQSCRSCMRPSVLTCSIILPSIIKYFQRLWSYAPETNCWRPLARPPMFIILITRVILRKTWLKMSLTKCKSVNCFSEGLRTCKTRTQTWKLSDGQNNSYNNLKTISDVALFVYSFYWFVRALKVGSCGFKGIIILLIYFLNCRKALFTKFQ